MSETKFYRGQPVIIDGYHSGLFDPDVHRADACFPVLGLSNVWYKWDGGNEPPCEGDQYVAVSYGGEVGVGLARYRMWHLVDWYMILEAPEVAK